MRQNTFKKNTVHVKRICPVCGEGFGVTLKSNAKYCSVACRTEGYKQTRERCLSADKEAANRHKSELKTHCSVCGYDRCKRGLCFHHIDGKGAAVSAINTVSGVHRELESHPCIVLCANCHAEVHAGILSLS